jgi:tRNA (guanine26-N2/guanine27-N2)-dimethyltransferase
MEMDKGFDDIIKQLEIKKEGTMRFYSYEPSDYAPKGTALTKSMPVFYNPKMVINRDITLLAYNVFIGMYREHFPDRSISICDSMAASGIRSLRLYDMFKDSVKIVANDLNGQALRLIRENEKLNGFDEKIILEKEDAIFLFHKLAKEGRCPTIIDIDPFGTPNVFIESAFTAIDMGGMIAATATDTPVLFGVRRDACYRKYNVRSLHSSFLKELGLRILLYYIASRGHPSNYSIEPYLSFSSDHYIRVFVKIFKGQDMVGKNMKNCGFILWCPHCDWRATTPMNLDGFTNKCPLCNYETDFGGPLWIGPLHNKTFIERIIENLAATTPEMIPSKEKLTKMLKKIQFEDNFPVGYYNIHKISDSMNIPVPSLEKVIIDIENEGYRAARTHIDDRSLKSDASIQIFQKILEKYRIKS